MGILPMQLGRESLTKEELSKDKKACRKFGPCGVGEKALYLNSFYIDRKFYVPVTSVERVYKRIAMSRGGYTGKGIFAAVPYLVVEYDGGKSRQFNFKHEEQVDEMLGYIGRSFPDIKLISSKGEKRRIGRELENQTIKYPPITEKAQRLASYLQNIQDYMDKRREIFDELAAASKKKRTFERTKSSYKWTAAAFLVFGILILLVGIYLAVSKGTFAISFVIAAIGAVILFSGINILPTFKSNRRTVDDRLKKAVSKVDEYMKQYPDFSFPARYAHPVTVKWMREAVLLGKAETVAEAYEYVKKELKRLNSDVKVEQGVYDDVITIKPLFLAWNYQ